MTIKMHELLSHPASYRDPSGFVFRLDGFYYRQVNKAYAGDYDLLMHSGLYKTLAEKRLLVSHAEINENLSGSPDWYKTLLPQQIPFISYPGEWAPAQLKEAALLTLNIMLIALDHGMILKDATPYNIQFHEGRPIFIDTLSFEKYDASKPWIAYRQFCESFLFPLYLQHYLLTGTHTILSAYPDGIPASVTARLLPLKSRFKLGVWLHVLLQSRIRSDNSAAGKQFSFSKEKLLRLLSNLEQILTRMNTGTGHGSTWSNYYEHTISSESYLVAKEKIFREFIRGLNFESSLDLGANDGYFSKILSEKKAPIVAVDADWQCIDSLYLFLRKQAVKNILPLCVDIAAPTPATGFRNAEHSSFSTRAPSGLVLALALLHHLILGKNIPLPGVAAYLSELTQVYLIVEFIPLTDEKAMELVRNKKNFHSYDLPFFIDQFSVYFAIEKQETIPGTERILFLMKKKGQL